MTSLQGVLVKVGFKTASLLRLLSKKNEINRSRKTDCTFGIGIYELVQSRRSLALSVLGGKANYVISAHHRGAAQRFLLNFTQKNDRTASLNVG